MRNSCASISFAIKVLLVIAGPALAECNQLALEGTPVAPSDTGSKVAISLQEQEAVDPASVARTAGPIESKAPTASDSVVKPETSPKKDQEKECPTLGRRSRGVPQESAQEPPASIPIEGQKDLIDVVQPRRH